MTDKALIDSMRQFQLEQFLIESNAIEGETWEQLPFKAAQFALGHVGIKKLPLRSILKIHKLHGEELRQQNNIELGKLRTCQVYVGSYVAPPPEKVPKLMEKFCEDWPIMDSWAAHCHFEAIHPFTDGNGRVGRLLWLIKAVEEGYYYAPPFLKKFYYQTLNHQQL